MDKNKERSTIIIAGAVILLIVIGGVALLFFGLFAAPTVRTIITPVPPDKTRATVQTAESTVGKASTVTTTPHFLTTAVLTPEDIEKRLEDDPATPTSEIIPNPTPAKPPTAMPTPDPNLFLITDDPIFVGGDVRLQGWSPDGRYLAYFEHTEEQLQQAPANIPGLAPGTFTFYDTVTGQKCQRYPLDGRFPYEGPGFGQRFTWLPNGDLLVFTEDGQVIQADIPCGEDENLTTLFPEQIQNIHSLSPNEQLLLLTGATAYWLYNIESRAITPIAEIVPDSFNNLVWSPEGTYIGVTLVGNYTGNRSPTGGTRVVDVATKQIIARHDWEPAIALDGAFGGPIWLNENEMVISISLDQGPFFMTVAGEVRPLLPLFGLEFKHGQFVPIVDVYVDPETSHLHLLLSDIGWGEEEVPPQIFHEDTGMVEMLEGFNDRSPNLMPGGILIKSNEDGSYSTRFIADEGASWIRPLSCAPPWQIPTSSYFPRLQGSNRVDIFTWPECDKKATMQLDWQSEGISHLNAGISPDNQWLTLVPTDKQGRGKALFITPFPELTDLTLLYTICGLANARLKSSR